MELGGRTNNVVVGTYAGAKLGFGESRLPRHKPGTHTQQDSQADCGGDSCRFHISSSRGKYSPWEKRIQTDLWLDESSLFREQIGTVAAQTVSNSGSRRLRADIQPASLAGWSVPDEGRQTP